MWESESIKAKLLAEMIFNLGIGGKELLKTAWSTRITNILWLKKWGVCYRNKSQGKLAKWRGERGVMSELILELVYKCGKQN
jgi:hypothetical protein